MTAKTAWRAMALMALMAAGARAEEPAATARAALGDDGGVIGAEVCLTGGVARPAAGGVYELYYQCRVHAKKGEAGPLLGTADFPRGKPFFVTRVTAGATPVTFEERVDVTRGLLSGMTNLTPWNPAERSYYEALLRVEPQVYDVAAKSFITPAKSPAVILVAYVGDHGKVLRVQPLAEKLRQAGAGGGAPAVAVAMLKELDAYDSLDNHIEEAAAHVLASKTATPEAKLAVLRAVPTGYVGSKDAHALNVALDELAAGDHAALKAEARKLLEAAKMK